MKTKLLLSLVSVLVTASIVQAQDTIWVRYDDRFKPNQIISLVDVDSIEMRPTQLRLFNDEAANGFTAKATATLLPTDACEMSFTNPGRYLLKPNTYSGTDYTNDAATSGYNFAHMVESEHCAVFWDVRYGNDPNKIQYPGDGNVANANTVLSIGEACFKKYVELGFMKVGEGTTDNYKIQFYIPYQSEWRADASGTDGAGGGKTGIGHFNPWAVTSRGGATVAHEVGHTFQYLVSADLGMQHGFNYGYGDNASGGNGWWESCANWQAYKVYPSRQFTDGEYLEGYLGMTHLNFMHEDMRYQNCFIHDYWCMKHGTDFIGRLWRESNKPEDPIQAYMRLNSLTLDAFAAEQFEGYCRMATWDIDGVRSVAAAKIGKFPTHLHRPAGVTDTYTWEVDSAYCPQNFGFNIINMKNVKAGTEIKAHFKGFTSSNGYRNIRPANAGWRYAFVAMTSTGQRVYGEMQSDKEGTATLTVPTGCQRIFFVVMGSPTAYWRHPWNDNAADDEQWPYQVQFENININ
ncbi:MAG: hypothetical protein J5486_09275 [Bacteroidaceae bacterium]|nr:hypothetical protein [Bacteroidaceae bacterium]